MRPANPVSCPQGHGPLAADQRYCTVCGVCVRCPDGHPVDRETRSSVLARRCGSPLQRSPIGAPSAVRVPSDPPAAGGSGRRPGGLLLGLVLALGAGMVAAGITFLGGGEPTGFSIDAPPTGQTVVLVAEGTAQLTGGHEQLPTNPVPQRLDRSTRRPHPPAAVRPPPSPRRKRTNVSSSWSMACTATSIARGEW